MSALPTQIDYVSAIAQLLSNITLRRAFRSDPEVTARKMQVCQHDLPELIKLNADALDAQADVLIRKRLHETAQRLPMTRAALGEEFDRRFSAFAEQYWPTSHRRHDLDAATFAAELIQQRVQGVCRTELNSVRFAARKTSWPRIHLGAHVLRRGRKHRTLQLLYQRRGIVHNWIIRLAI